MPSNLWSSQQLEQFNHDGFLVVPGLFTPEEIGPIQKIAVLDVERRKTSWAAKDASGRASQLWLDSEVRDDAYGALVRCARVVEPVQQILGGPVYSWHYKMMQKEPKVGGAWEWHQDYGYWYGDKCVFPNLVSCMIAINRASRANGCLQVIRGSNRVGRINHGTVGGQAGADAERVAAVLARLELFYGELEPGDALFFHCNTLHCSGPNDSDQPRWSFITCYNAMDNVPFDGKGHGKPIQLEPADDSIVLDVARRQLAAIQNATAVAT